MLSCFVRKGGARLGFTGLALTSTLLAVSLQVGCQPKSQSPVVAQPVKGPKLSFNEHIQPILSDNCYACHGSDAGSRKGELRLDRPEDAFAARKTGPAIVKGNPARSPLIQRLHSKDPAEIMPPPETHKTLSPDQIAMLEQWVREGAEYEEHWAFVAPRRPAEPANARLGWARNAIDRFVLARLEKEALAPSAEAERSALLRRVTYDLTGLPPTPAEIEAFAADTAPDAYERVVDRLLASPRYGEHRARYWLDYARYADTHGMHLDNLRSIWPYRDYVIRAFNANKPFDQFTREQLAGDMLPARNLDQQLASAFIRAGISSGEGGTIVEELRVNNQRERVEAFGAVYLGLTTACAACHDHKFDPTSQKDHYQLSAFFNNLAENPSNDDRADWPPFIRWPDKDDRARYDETLARRAEVEAALMARRAQASDLIEKWIAAGAAAQPVSTEGLQVQLRFDEQSGSTFHNTAPHPTFATTNGTGGVAFWGEDTWFWPSYRMDTTTRIEIPNTADVDGSEAFSVGTWFMPRLETAASGSPSTGSILGRMDSTNGNRGWDLGYSDGRLSFRMMHAEATSGIHLETNHRVLARGRWNHVLATYDGSGRAAGVRLYVDGELQDACVVRDALTGSVRTAVPFQLGSIHPDARPLRQSRFQDLRFYARELTRDEAPRVAREDYVAGLVKRAPDSWNEDERQAVADFYFAHRDSKTRELLAQLEPLEEELTELTKDGPIALVAEETPRLAYADVLDRGAYTARKERVRPDVPHFLPPLPPDAPHDRRGLAEWTMSEENPLTARVAVNRMWAELFGTGIVETTEDFGIVGSRPSHPQLLDWLAVEFRESGWDMKHIYRLLVTSAMYRQSAKVTPALLERDPKNRLLARGPRFRMDAEMLRDTALAASGLLVQKEGGPSVKPYQPPGVWEAGGYPSSNTTKYAQDTGDALYRRSLYSFWKRMATLPNMDAFDAPTRDVSCTRRQRTNTPVQALVTMNDVQWLEAARHLAENLVSELPTDDEARFRRLGQLMLARDWRPEEKAVLTRQLESFRATYTANPESATELIAVGESKQTPGLPAPEVAAWMLVASTAFNLDATLNK
jgi:mono/diheme cytochrome c family protein